MYRLLWTGFISLSLGISIAGCGPNKGKKGGSTSGPDSTKKAFQIAGSDYELPERYLMAVAYLESKISPKLSWVPYYQIEGDDPNKEIGSPLLETAFGLSRQTLGLDNSEDSDSLPVQIDAYAKWLRSNLDASSFELTKKPSKPDDHYQWLWQLAGLHRRGEEQLRNVRVIWAKELMTILNQGFVWQDPDSGERIVLEPESKEIDMQSFPAEGRKLFRLEDQSSDLSPNARRFDIVSNLNTLRQTPHSIKVIHCPLSLSGCLELQDPNVPSDLRLGAHMIIPQNELIYSRALEIADFDRRIELTGADGSSQDVKDTYVIMLAGNSGRYIDGIRADADPTWFTPWQLQRLGAVVSGICRYFSSEFDKNYDDCRTIDSQGGITFQHQRDRPSYRWGDIPDYDKAIFAEYVSSRNTSGEVVLEFPKKEKTYKAGKDIEVFARFQPGARYIRLQRAVRCSNDQLVWETFVQEGIRGATDKSFKFKIWDAGPNLNGRHFLRVLVFGEDSELNGWVIDDLFIDKFEEDYNPPSEACF